MQPHTAPAPAPAPPRISYGFETWRAVPAGQQACGSKTLSRAPARSTRAGNPAPRRQPRPLPQPPTAERMPFPFKSCSLACKQHLLFPTNSNPGSSRRRRASVCPSRRTGGAPTIFGAPVARRACAPSTPSLRAREASTWHHRPHTSPHAAPPHGQALARLTTHRRWQAKDAPARRETYCPARRRPQRRTGRDPFRPTPPPAPRRPAP